MVKSKFAQICDTIFFVLGFSFVVYAWINKYIKINLLSFVLTVALSLVVAWIIWTASTNKINKKNLKTQELKFAQECIDYFCLHPKETLSFFCKILPSAKINGDFLTYENALYFFDYDNEETSTKTLAKIIQFSGNNKAYLFSSNLSKRCQTLLSQTNIVWVQDYDCYLLMKEHNTFPITQQPHNINKKQKLKNMFVQSIARKKAKPYFLYGVLLLLSSFFMPYSLLYCIIGSVSVCLSLLCLIFRNKTNNNLS